MNREVNGAVLSGTAANQKTLKSANQPASPVQARDWQIDNLQKTLALRNMTIKGQEEQIQRLEAENETLREMAAESQPETRTTEAGFWKKLYEREHAAEVKMYQKNDRLRKEHSDLLRHIKVLELAARLSAEKCGQNPDAVAAEAERKVPLSRIYGAGMRARGAQSGHTGHRRKQLLPDQEVLLEAPEVVREHPEDWEESGEVKCHTQSQIRLVPVTTLYCSRAWKNRLTGQTVRAPFPADMINETSYGSTIRALTCLLGGFCQVSMHTVQRILFSLSDGELEPSMGWISRLKKECANLSKAEQKQLMNALVQEPETPAAKETDFPEANPVAK